MADSDYPDVLGTDEDRQRQIEELQGLAPRIGVAGSAGSQGAQSPSGGITAPPVGVASTGTNRGASSTSITAPPVKSEASTETTQAKPYAPGPARQKLTAFDTANPPPALSNPTGIKGGLLKAAEIIAPRIADRINAVRGQPMATYQANRAPLETQAAQEDAQQKEAAGIEHENAGTFEETQRGAATKQTEADRQRKLADAEKAAAGKPNEETQKYQNQVRVELAKSGQVPTFDKQTGELTGVTQIPGFVGKDTSDTDAGAKAAYRAWLSKKAQGQKTTPQEDADAHAFEKQQLLVPGTITNIKVGEQEKLNDQKLAQLTPEAQTIVVNTMPTMQQVDQILQALEPYKNDNTSGKFAMARAAYTLGHASPEGELGSDISKIELNRVVDAARILKGSSRAYQSLQLALKHTPNSWIDSPMLMYQKLQTIRQNLSDIVEDAKKYGPKGYAPGATSAPAQPGGTAKPTGNQWNPKTGRYE